MNENKKDPYFANLECFADLSSNLTPKLYVPKLIELRKRLTSEALAFNCDEDDLDFFETCRLILFVKFFGFTSGNRQCFEFTTQDPSYSVKFTKDLNDCIDCLERYDCKNS